MTQPRGTATNQLSTVITALQLGQKTGVLAIERGEGETFEEGTIIFVHGKVAQAAIRSFTGREAATKLLSWQACRFSFTSLLPNDSAIAAHLVPHPQSEAKETTQNGHKPLSRDPDISGRSNATAGGTQNGHKPLAGNHQAHSKAEGNINYRPSATVPQGSMDEALRILEHQGFSRLHRRLLLLIDGRRSISELATLIGRTQNETETLLADLWRVGLTRV